VAARLVILALLVFASTATAFAEPLQRVHVRSFTLTSDTQHPRVEVPFDVTLTIRVAENLSRLNNVYLPTFTGPEELGDERQLQHDKGGTVYRETMRLVAHSSGALSIGSAYFDAIDARDGKAKRFISGALQLTVAGPAADMAKMLRDAARIAGLAMLLALLIGGGVGWLRKRAQRPLPPAPEPQPVPAPPDPPPTPVEDALADLRRKRDRGAVMRLRSALRRDAGAREGETLEDVLFRLQPGNAPLRRMLTIVERAAFVDQTRLQSAIDDVLSETEETTA
jgi:hypothetical protein